MSDKKSKAKAEPSTSNKAKASKALKPAQQLPVTQVNEQAPSAAVPTTTQKEPKMTEATTPAKAKKPETVVETVKMLNGTICEFAGKRKMIKSTSIVDGKVVVTLNFRNGETRIFTVPANMVLQFAGHGAEQKLGDETAGVEDIDDALLAVDDLMDRLNKGEWGIRREAGGMSGTSVLMKALCELYSKPVEAIKAFLSNKTQAEKLALRNNAKVKLIVDRLEAEKVSKKGAVDTDALLGQLDALGAAPTEEPATTA
jgi:hypothetical protein